MTSSELKRLISDMQANPLLGDELRQRRGDPDAMIRLAAGKGYWLTRSDVGELVLSMDELSDDELDQAAGGAWNDPPPPGTTGSGSTGG
jgi:predicted ribosomally synthesized peptide with nif11-like leader